MSLARTGRRGFATAVTLSALGVIGFSATAADAVTRCDTSLEGEFTISGEVRAGPGCELLGGVTVTGNVRVLPGGSLFTDTGSSPGVPVVEGNVDVGEGASLEAQVAEVKGTIYGSHARSVELKLRSPIGPMIVGGSVILRHTTEQVLIGSVPPESGAGPTIDGDLVIRGGSLIQGTGKVIRGSCSLHVGIGFARIGGSLEIANDTATLDECPYDVADNYIGGDLKVGLNRACSSESDAVVFVGGDEVLGELKVFDNAGILTGANTVTGTVVERENGPTPLCE